MPVIKAALPQAAIALELGRYLVGESGVYVCRVIDKKISRGQMFLVTDGGLHHHLAASGNFGQVIRKNYPVLVANRVGAAATETASVVGPLCTPLDLLADRMVLAEAQVGDLVAVFQSGAYGFTASPRSFLSHPEPGGAGVLEAVEQARQLASLRLPGITCDPLRRWPTPVSAARRRHELEQGALDFIRRIQRRKNAGACLFQRTRRIADRVGERHDGPPCPQVLIKLGRHLRIAVRRLQYQQPVDAHHLLQCRKVVHARLETHDVVDARSLHIVAKARLIAGCAKYELQAVGSDGSLALQCSNCRKQIRGVTLTAVDDSAVQQR